MTHFCDISTLIAKWSATITLSTPLHQSRIPGNMKHKTGHFRLGQIWTLSNYGIIRVLTFQEGANNIVDGIPRGKIPIA